MPLIDVSRQTTLNIDPDSTLIIEGKISVIDNGQIAVTHSGLYIAGQAVGATADEINMLMGARSNVQNQIDDLTTALDDISADGEWVDQLTHINGVRFNDNTAIIYNYNVNPVYDKSKYLIAINGVVIGLPLAITSITNVSNDIQIVFNLAALGYSKLKSSDIITLWGPVQ